MENEFKTEQKSGGSKSQSIIIVLLIIVILGLVGLMSYDKFVAKKESEKPASTDTTNKTETNNQTNNQIGETTNNNQTNNQTEEKTTNSNETTTDNTNSSTNNTNKGCNGVRDAVYYGEYHGKSGNFETHSYHTLTLKKDGTFLSEWRNAGGETGTYSIKNNVLTVTYDPNTGYSPASYSISSDCSSIQWIDTKLTLKK